MELKNKNIKGIDYLIKKILLLLLTLHLFQTCMTFSSEKHKRTVVQTLDSIDFHCIDKINE